MDNNYKIKGTVKRLLGIIMKGPGATTYLDVTLGSQVVNLCGLHFVDDLYQAGTVRQVTVMQLHV